MPSKQAHNVLLELFTTEGRLIKNIEQFLTVIDILKKQIKLPKDLSLQLYFDTISRTYSQLLELLKLTCLFELSNQYKTLEEIQANLNVIIEILHQALVEQKQAENLLFTLSAIANNETFFTSQLLNFSKAIQWIYEGDFIQKSTDIPNIITANQGDFIQYFRNHLVAPIQRLTKYPLLFKELKSEELESEELAIKTTDTYIKNLSFHIQAVTDPRHQAAATPSKRKIKSITQILSEYVRSSTQAANQVLPAQYEKTAPYTPSKYRIPTINQYVSPISQQTVSADNAANSIAKKSQAFKLDNENNENNGTQLIGHALQVLTNWRQQKSKWPLQIERLYYQLYEIYFRLRTCDRTIIRDLIEEYIKEIKLSKRKSQAEPLVDELNKLLENEKYLYDENFQGSHQEFSINPPNEDLNVPGAHQFIRQPILERILEAMQSFQQYSSGSGLTYPSDLEVKIFSAIYHDLDALNKHLGSYTVKSENFWIDVIKIFQQHTHIAGEFPRYFYHSKFGHMLRQVAFQLDQFKPAECRPAFELITAPEGYHYTDFNKVPGHIMAIGKEHLTPDRLCLNVQRIMDFYCNTGLGKLVAEDVQGQKLNLDQGWRKLIMQLDETITQIYLNQAGGPEEEILLKMIEKIEEVAKNIRSHFWQGKRSRLAGSLESLAKLFKGETLSKEHYQEAKHLPAGIITSAQDLDSGMVENYLKKHIVQRACNPFINYYQDTSQRFFRRAAAPAKLRHTDVITEQLNKFYQNPLPVPADPESIAKNTNQLEDHKKSRQLSQSRIKLFVQKQLLEVKGPPVKLHSAHGNSVAASSNYLKKIVPA